MVAPLQRQFLQTVCDTAEDVVCNERDDHGGIHLATRLGDAGQLLAMKPGYRSRSQNRCRMSHRGRAAALFL